MITGHEDYDAKELYCMLGGDAVPMNDVHGIHGCLMLLCKRVAALEAAAKQVDPIEGEWERQIAALMRDGKRLKAVQLYKSRRYTTSAKDALQECRIIALRHEGAGS